MTSQMTAKAFSGSQVLLALEKVPLLDVLNKNAEGRGFSGHRSSSIGSSVQNHIFL